MEEVIRDIMLGDGWVEGEYSTAERITTLFRLFILWLKKEQECVNIRTNDMWIVGNKLLTTDEVFEYWYNKIYKDETKKVN